MTKPTHTHTLEAANYEDHDDCLMAARQYIAERDCLELWETTAQWGDADGAPDVDDNSRETIIVTVAS